MTDIAFTKVSLPFGWMGNMSPYPVEYKGVVFRSSEALFQARRLPWGHEGIEAIRLEKSPMSAKMVAKRYRDEWIIQPWSDEDIELMIEVVRLKFTQHPALAKALIATEDRMIYEDVGKRRNRSGTFWGAYREGSEWIGDNVLGMILMGLREELKRYSDII